MPAIISHQEPEPQVPGPKPQGPGPTMGPPPVPPHNYANLPSGHGHAGARPRPTNPLYGRREDLPSYTDVVRREQNYNHHQGSYEAETLRVENKMTLPPPYQPYSLDQQSSQRSSQSDAYPPHHYGQEQHRPVPAQSPRESVSDNQSDRYAQIQDYNPLPDNRYYQENPQQMNGHHTGYPEPDRLKGRENPDSGIHSMDPVMEQPPLKRVPNGHAARDRASLRLKQRKDMEAKAAAGRAAKLNGDDVYLPTYVNGSQTTGHRLPSTEDDYGFSGEGNKAVNGRPAGLNGYADMSGKQPQQEVDDKWYLKDSMRPVGASTHGLNCKCYRCQRKLTAI